MKIQNLIIMIIILMINMHLKANLHFNAQNSKKFKRSKSEFVISF